MPKASQRAAELRQGGSQNTPWGTMPKKYEKVWSAWTLFGPISDQNYVKIEKTRCQQALENYRQKTLKIYANRMPKSTQNRCQIAPEIYAKRSCGKIWKIMQNHVFLMYKIMQIHHTVVKKQGLARCMREHEMSSKSNEKGDQNPPQTQ